MSYRTIRLAFGFLFFLGLAVIGFGAVGPTAGGLTFADVMVERLQLPKDPDIYLRIAEIHADSEARRSIATCVLGFAILIPATAGLWALAGSSYSGPPNPTPQDTPGRRQGP